MTHEHVERIVRRDERDQHVHVGQLGRDRAPARSLREPQLPAGHGLADYRADQKMRDRVHGPEP